MQRIRTVLIAGILISAFSGSSLGAAGDWRIYGGDAGNTRHSPLAQITPRNVATLKPVWSWDSGELAPSFETTPLVVGGVMYVSTPKERVVALDASTGREIWSFDPKLLGSSTHRGVSYWPGDSQYGPRIVFGTTDGKIFALDAKTGLPAEGFGDRGVIDLRARLGAKGNVLFGFSSPPAIYKNLAIFGPRTAEGGPKGPDASIRAFDVRTGKEVWTFHTLPRPGEAGYETWGPEFWLSGGGGPSAWAPFTVDTARGMVFVPVGNPTGGGDPAGRQGDNLYSDSVVALDAATGKRIWFYQMVHHDVWDYDVPASPTLIDVKRGGKIIPALAQITKHGFLFILDRRTGKPIFGVAERPVPASKVPGEILSPTQPFPLRPVPLARNSISPAELSHVSPQSARYCAGLLADRDYGGPFTPRSPRGTVNFPSSIGGGNWGGVSYDSRLGLIFVNSSNLGSLSGPQRTASAPPREEARAPGAVRAAPGGNNGGGGGNRFVDQDRYPCNQPPWGELIAVNANSGAIAWRKVLGGYKALEDKGIDNAGAVNAGASMVTASGVLFIGATNDRQFRAFDAKSGKLLWTVGLDGNALAEPMTFMGPGGKQMLVVATGGPSYMGGVGPLQPPVNGKVTVFALP